ncbi:MAG: hypothetical protein SPK70_08935 [Succinivibrio dextrinosolvens]|nr:hypothetical protein [Succinivibrio dextrinosolvens]
MYKLTYEELKNKIADEEYKNYRIVLKTSKQEYSFRNFMNDLDAVYSNRYPTNCILQNVKKTAEPEKEIIIQKMILRPATDLGLEDLNGFGYPDFEDYAEFKFQNEFELLQQVSKAVEQFVENAAKCFGKNDPVY